MTLEDVLNRVSQMNRADRWTLWTLCGRHEPDALPGTEAGEAKRPRYCRNAGPPLVPKEYCGTLRVDLMTWVRERCGPSCAIRRTHDAGQI